jgi:hypothetical protein
MGVNLNKVLHHWTLGCRYDIRLGEESTKFVSWKFCLFKNNNLCIFIFFQLFSLNNMAKKYHLATHNMLLQFLASALRVQIHTAFNLLD